MMMIFDNNEERKQHFEDILYFFSNGEHGRELEI